MTEDITYRLRVPSPNEVTVECGFKPISITVTEPPDPKLPKIIELWPLYVDVNDSPDRVKANTDKKFDYQWMQRDIVLPTIVANSKITAYNSVRLNGVLPSIKSISSFKFDNIREIFSKVKLENRIIVAASVNVPTGVVGEFKLPAIKLEALAAVPAQAKGTATLQKIQSRSLIVEGRIVRSAITLPPIKTTGKINVPIVATAAIKLPSIVTTSSKITVSRNITGAGVIPNLISATMDFKLHRVINTNVKLPVIKTNSYVKVPIVINNTAKLPLIRSNALLGVPTHITASVVLPHPITAHGVLDFVKHVESHAVLPRITTSGLIATPTKVTADLKLNTIRAVSDIKLIDKLNGNIILNQIVSGGLISDATSNNITPIILSDSQLLIGDGVKLIKLGEET